MSDKLCLSQILSPPFYKNLMAFNAKIRDSIPQLGTVQIVHCPDLRLTRSKQTKHGYCELNSYKYIVESLRSKITGSMFPLLLERMYKMSLFHNIKLKRRKVDSRCSSDGETNPDPNNSSPDSVVTLEPVLKEEELVHFASEFPLGSGEGGEESLITQSEDPNRSPDTNMLEEELESVKGSPMQSVQSPSQQAASSEREMLSSSSQDNVFHDEGKCTQEGAPEVRSEKPKESLEERGLDLSASTRQRVFIEELPHLNPHLWSPSSAQAYKRHFSAHEERPHVKQQSVSSLRGAPHQKMPLVMSDIPISGAGETVIWTSPSQGLQPSEQTSTSSIISSEIPVSRRHSVSNMERIGLLGRPVSSRSHPLSLYTSTPTSPITSSAPTIGQCGISAGPISGLSAIGNYPSFDLQYGTNVQRIPFTATSTSTSREDVLPQFRSRSSSLVSTSLISWSEKLPQPGPSSPTQLPDTQALNLSVSGNGRKEEPTVMAATPSTSRGPEVEEEETEQPMVCMICEDKATGLHYGIITCEGCKGFFKRTVQNKRVYTCVADGNCEITKAQRNRCQYCRFQKCLRQGMVLAAVREDRMPGGRNSGAVYNLYKVKYKKHKKGQKNGQVRQEQQKPPSSRYPQQEWANGQILKTALTNPADVMHLRHRLENCVTSSRDRQMPVEQALSSITQLIQCDDFEDVATLSNLQDLLSIKSELSEKLCQIGDNIVFKLVQWTTRLPFYSELPVTVHTQLLTHKWHEILVLTTCAYQAIHGPIKGSEASLEQDIAAGLCRLQTCLAAMMGRPITLDQLRSEAGPLVEHLTQLSSAFRRMRLCIEEYVCLKVIIMLNQEEYQGQRELEAIQERYLAILREFIEHRFPQQPSRFSDLLARLPEVHAAAGLLLQSKMFYVPFILNTRISR
ncbi:ecdysone receptor-like isoform X2 [Limulus polyphemus]|uniref:Ecdysone receptor-like isoform X2 n=1 Tax=Limulus polyphemus TaxID=6850 RepID=A0ABM1SF80_LIMPO|nr:ecdysone receptor-like isoform X2 [Limulus polyphemus]